MRSLIEPDDVERIGELVIAAGLVEWMWMVWCIGAERHLTGIDKERGDFKDVSSRDDVLKQWKRACPADKEDLVKEVRGAVVDAKRVLRDYRNPFLHSGAMPTDGGSELFHLKSDAPLDLDLLPAGIDEIRAVATKLRRLPSGW